ncbi:MAG: hypothetical protein ACM3X4_03500 [Ignavibacteriales bacterium]
MTKAHISAVPGKQVKICEIDQSAVTGAVPVQQRMLKATVTTDSDGEYEYQFSPGQSTKYVAVYESAGGSTLATSNQAEITVTTLRVPNTRIP